jgi:hypothetical protein
VIGKFVLVRTTSAGVHCGVLLACHGTAVRLAGARRVWRWRGANSLHELSLHGASRAWTRISEPVEEILLTQAVEVIPCTQTATENLKQSRWDKS